MNTSPSRDSTTADKLQLLGDGTLERESNGSLNDSSIDCARRWSPSLTLDVNRDKIETSAALSLICVEKEREFCRFDFALRILFEKT